MGELPVDFKSGPVRFAGRDRKKASARDTPPFFLVSFLLVVNKKGLWYIRNKCSHSG